MHRFMIITSAASFNDRNPIMTLGRIDQKLTYVSYLKRNFFKIFYLLEKQNIFLFKVSLLKLDHIRIGLKVRSNGKCHLTLVNVYNVIWW